MRVLIVFLIAVVAGCLLSGLAVAGAFVLLVALNGFSESDALPILVIYGILAVVGVVGVPTGIVVVGMRRGSRKPDGEQPPKRAALGVGLGAGAIAVLCLLAGGWYLTWTGPKTSGGGKTCTHGKKPVEVDDMVLCKTVCKTKSDCKYGAQDCVPGAVRILEDGTKGATVGHCEY